MWPEYFLFLLKTLTLAVAVIFVVAAVVSVVAQARNTQAGDSRLKPLKIRRLNDEIESRRKQLREALHKTDAGWKAKWADLRRRLPGSKKKESEAPTATEEKPAEVTEEKGEAEASSRTFVLRFHGDIRASAVEALREEVSAVLQVAEPGRDRVFLVLDSPGGVVPGYGLAAAQLARLRSAEIELIAVVDRVAASGGYMMAAVANRIVAAPFAIVGSIGVVAQLPNIHRLLKRNDIDVELHTAGQYKRTLTLLGENTEAGREKFREELEQTHVLFKDFLNRYRPQLDLDKLATGEHWYGEDALELALIDEIGTSDDLVLEAVNQGDAFEITQPMKKRGLLSRLSASAQAVLSEWRQPL
ncbi:protease SohB [Guyparkeria halophila]|uniref:Protease SohB n=1 Tax=Guyparkeria halophila TaxID=47960 RepID=A0ABZ0Z0N1_9GAMM|nr:protease SohB [Guyparkeria halophila]WQH17057.1 protease SohB [Guyparkeria halophila]